MLCRRPSSLPPPTIVESDVPPTLPVIEVETPPVTPAPPVRPSTSRRPRPRVYAQEHGYARATARRTRRVAPTVKYAVIAASGAGAEVGAANVRDTLAVPGLLLHAVRSAPLSAPSPRHTGSRRFAACDAHLLHFLAALSLVAAPAIAMAAPGYAWQFSPGEQTLAQRIAPPPGFTRTAVRPDSWAAWLRGLPMKPANAPVLIYTGAQKWRQDVHVAVIDIDVGKRDLQQCADAIMRLRAEWLFAADRKRDIRFNDTEGKRLSFSARRDSGYASFRKYMDYVFAYAGTYSLERELKPAPLGVAAGIGDVFIKGGFPGHAVLVADIAENAADGREALPARAELHARAGDARPQEPGGQRRLAVVPGGVRWASSSRPSGPSPPALCAAGPDRAPPLVADHHHAARGQR